jgi:pimeloyl-ACP methyl ester carboxylesterase
VIHSYRHRHGNASGEPRFKEMEAQLAKRPPVAAPTITLYGADDGIGGSPAEATPAEKAVLPALVAHRLIAGVGHFMPRERPEAVASAVLELLR